MPVTEADARQRWCPFHGKAIAGHIRTMPDGKVNASMVCIGSLCMSWRWVGGVEITGYCGLAGADDGPPPEQLAVLPPPLTS